MASVFARANKVNAYLDPSLTRSELPIWLQTTTVALTDWHARHSYANNSSKIAMLNALDELFSSPWLHRVWVIQEAVVARKLHFVHRGLYIEWHVFDQLLATRMKFVSGGVRSSGDHAIDARVSTKSKSSSLRYTDGVLAERILRARQISSVRNLWAATSVKLPPLEDLLFQGRQAQASDARDKIYAFLALSELEYEIPISCSVPTDEVYITAMRAIFQKSKRFDALAFAGRRSETSATRERLPSWVASWDSCCCEAIKIPPRKSLNEQMLASVRLHPLTETKSHKPDRGPSSQLAVDMWNCDYVCLLAPAFELGFDRIEEAGWQLDLQRKLRHLWKFTVLAYTETRLDKSLTVAAEPLRASFMPAVMSTDELWTAFWNTLVCGHVTALTPANAHSSNSTSEPQVAEDGELFRIFDRYLEITNQDVEVVYPLDSPSAAEALLRTGTETFVGIEDSTTIRRGAGYVDKVLALMTQNISSTFRDGRIFGLTASACLAIFPSRTTIGQTIAVINGAYHPFVVQNKDGSDGYELIGQCFVDDANSLGSSPAVFQKCSLV